jgi:CMP-2-keto-3-deoxyoctulosonic acid synthetase
MEMKIIGSVIARAGSKRLPYKNLLPFKGVPLVRRAILQLIECELFSTVVLSTDSELIARTCMDINELSILKRPESLAADNIASIPVFQHIVENFSCDIHLNYNCNFPDCPDEVFRQAISLAKTSGEALSDPYAVWAQSVHCLRNYGDPFNIKAKIFKVSGMNPIDIHTETDLLDIHQQIQEPLSW